MCVCMRVCVKLQFCTYKVINIYIYTFNIVK